MLVYGLVMILVMLATNSPAVQDFVNARFRKKKKKEGVGQ